MDFQANTLVVRLAEHDGEEARRADFDYYKLLGRPLNLSDYGPPTGLRK